MSIDAVWGCFFKPETRASGQKLFAQEKVAISSGSDTSIHAFVRIAPPLRVRFDATDIASTSFVAGCSCTDAKKGQFCKHVWATLLSVEQDYPDFLAHKRAIEQGSVAPDAQAQSAKEPFQARANLRAAAYRKEQYQKQKSRAKELKQAGSKRQVVLEVKTYPADVEVALAFFSVNGFPMAMELNEIALGEAKRKLSRVFHPDRGGSHAEITELNGHSEVVLKFLRGREA